MTDNRNLRLRRARPVVALAAVAFVIGAIVGAQAGASATDTLGEQYVTAWSHGDYATMYADLDAASKRAVSPSAFANANESALRTATATHLSVTGKAKEASGGHVSVPVRVQSRLFGTLPLSFTLRTVQESGSPKVVWSRSIAFPGLRPGELLSRRMTLPARATLLARDGSVLAEGSASTTPGSTPSETTRSSPLGEAAGPVLGTVGPAPASRAAALEAQGVPADALVGLSGVERALDDRLRGSPGGELLAGERVLAYAAPHAAATVRTSVSPAIQRAAVAALGGQYGGVVVMQPSTGEILAVAGLGLDGLQPPGSTFKMITLSAVLKAGLANPHTVFPYATYATLDGVKLSNANGEECGGTLELAFAVSCNSVFAPLGAKVGSAALVSMAEAFGFNHQPPIPGAAESTLPPASQIKGELDTGSTAIGQGEVDASPLQMAMVAATIANGGRRPTPTFVTGSPAALVPALSSSVAHTDRHLMIGVVRGGTGTAAQIPGVEVAGKTGTAELKSACTPSSESTESSESGKESSCAGENEASNTDAWFAAFAPAYSPKLVVCVMLVKDGAGGATAAPVAREILEAGLKAGI